jgi:hypothetical protein
VAKPHPGGTGGGQQAGQRAHYQEFNQLRARQLLPRGAQRAQQARFAGALILRAHQRRRQHQHAGYQREAEQEFHRHDHPVQHRLHLAQHGAHVDHRQIRILARQR